MNKLKRHTDLSYDKIGAWLMVLLYALILKMLG